MSDNAAPGGSDPSAKRRQAARRPVRALQSGPQAQYGHLQSLFNKFDDFKTAHSDSRVFVGVLSGYSNKSVKFYYHNMEGYTERLAATFTGVCAEKGGRAVQGRLQGDEFADAHPSFPDSLGAAFDKLVRDGWIGSEFAKILLNVLTNDPLDANEPVRVAYPEPALRKLGPKVATGKTETGGAAGASGGAGTEAPACVDASGLEGEVTSPARAGPITHAAPAVSLFEDQNATLRPTVALARAAVVPSAPAPSAAAPTQAACMPTTLAAQPEEMEEEPIIQGSRKRRAHQVITEDDSEDDAHPPADCRNVRIRRKTQRALESTEQITELRSGGGEGGTAGRRRHVFGEGGFLDKDQEAELKVYIEEEHKARWDSNSNKLRKAKPTAGQASFQAAVRQRMCERWPCLTLQLLDADITNAKARFWKGSKGKCPHELESAAAAEEAAQLNAAAQQAAADALRGIPGATASWEQLVVFMDASKEELDAGSLEQWRTNQLQRAKVVDALCGSWKQGKVKEQQKRIGDFQLELRQALFA